MPGRINGFTVAYTAIGGVVLWSGVTGQSLTATFQSLLKGQAPQQAPGTEQTPAAAAADNEAVIAAVSGTGTEPGVSAPTSSSESAWVSAFLSAVNAPETAANVASVEDWIRHEGPFGTQGQNNPLNTTQTEAGSSSFAGLAVQNYPTSAEGLEAIVQTLNNGDYPQILMQLRAGHGLLSGAEADLSKWSGGGYSSV